MMKTTVSLLLVAVAFGATTVGLSTFVSAQVLSGPVINPANGHQYYLLAQSDWTTSEAWAQSLFNAHLVTINDAAENQWVHDTFATFGGVQRALLIGFNDVETEGTFVWSSGETPGYTNWRAGEPNNFNGIEHYAVMAPPEVSTLGQWNDVPNWASSQFTSGGTSYGHYGVVEVVPEPTSLLMVGLTAIGVISRRRRRS